MKSKSNTAPSVNTIMNFNPIEKHQCIDYQRFTLKLLFDKFIIYVMLILYNLLISIFILFRFLDKFNL